MMSVKKIKTNDPFISRLPDEAIFEFKDLFRKRYRIELSDEEASFRANNLVGLYASVYGKSKMVKKNG